MAEQKDFMGHHWVQIEGDSVVVGVNEDGVSEIGEIEKLDLPEEGQSFEAEEICAEIHTDEGGLNLYAPVAGRIVEINAAVVDDPNLILEDPMGDGWIFRLEAENADDLDSLK